MLSFSLSLKDHIFVEDKLIKDDLSDFNVEKKTNIMLS